MCGRADLGSALEAFRGRLGIDRDELGLMGSIGSGCTAKVFEGRWRGRDVAVKRIEVDDAKTSVIVRELGVMARIQHPNLVCLLGFCYDEEHPTFDVVLELCRGGTLFSLLHISDQEVSFEQQLKLAEDIAQGMAYLHGLDPPVVHRDLKSLNVLLREPLASSLDVPDAKITDFGMAKMNFQKEKLARRQASGRRPRGLPGLRRHGAPGQKCKTEPCALFSRVRGVRVGGDACSSMEELPCVGFGRADSGAEDADGMSWSAGDFHGLRSTELRSISKCPAPLRVDSQGGLSDELPSQGYEVSPMPSNGSSAAARRSDTPRRPSVTFVRFEEEVEDETDEGGEEPGASAAVHIESFASEAESQAGSLFSSLGTSSCGMSGTMSVRVGTLQWMSPELISGSSNYTSQVDVYAYGMLLFEIMCFEPPFCELELDDLEAFVLEGGRPEVDWDSMPDQFARLTQACWAQDAAQRPTFSTIVRALDAIHGEDESAFERCLGMESSRSRLMGA